MKLDKSDWQYLFVAAIPFALAFGFFAGVETTSPKETLEILTLIVISISVTVAFLSYHKSNIAKQDAHTIEWINRYAQIMGSLNRLDIHKQLKERYPKSILELQITTIEWTEITIDRFINKKSQEIINEEQLFFVNSLIDGLNQGIHNKKCVENLVGHELLGQVILTNKSRILKEQENFNNHYPKELLSDLTYSDKPIFIPFKDTVSWFKDRFPVAYSKHFYEVYNEVLKKKTHNNL